MVKACLYCGLQFVDTAHFCPTCGRPTESGFVIRPLQQVELDLLRKQVKEQGELIHHLALNRTRLSQVSRAASLRVVNIRIGGS